MVEVHRVQRPVGQGGFHTCSVNVDRRRFNYVYDCGSVQKRALQRETDAYSEEIGVGRPIDLLSLSHLDDDHVNGIERLLASHDAHAVLLPYLHPWDRLLLVAEACARGHLTESYFALLADPTRWFTDRGTTRVIYAIGPGGDGPLPVQIPENIPPERRKYRDPTALVGGRPATQQEAELNPGLSVHATVVGAGEALLVVAGHQVAWQLVPYVHPEPSRLAAFAKEVAAVLGVPVLRKQGSPRYFEELKAALRDKVRRAALADAYDELRGDRNLASMSLFSGPWWRGRGDRIARNRDGWVEHDERVGWIGTGDAVLKRENRARAFARCLGPVFGVVGSLVVPHHGSRHNFAGDLFRDELHGIRWVVPYGRNAYDHPWPALVAALNRRGRVERVRERPGGAFEEHIVFE